MEQINEIEKINQKRKKAKQTIKKILHNSKILNKCNFLDENAGLLTKNQNKKNGTNKY